MESNTAFNVDPRSCCFVSLHKFIHCPFISTPKETTKRNTFQPKRIFKGKQFVLVHKNPAQYRRRSSSRWLPKTSMSNPSKNSIPFHSYASILTTPAMFLVSFSSRYLSTSIAHRCHHSLLLLLFPRLPLFGLALRASRPY